ncbi:UNKNOWN [Stylonychia lemnae]|uniref:Uncharacterized protein n=1 Tax=Stylonychia lemnae TaxID=5949 RepID=A0A078B5X6_STYLE|nr:UNKNOWN [Stylonychia lemnae]|eukprot:CDW88722.1 UNKNOWN [Stylonychia lemnae]
MNKTTLSVLLLIAFLGSQVSGQTVKPCTSNSDCKNFDGKNVDSCCYTLSGIYISTGNVNTQKMCDYTSSPTYSIYATQLGYKSVSGSCSSSSVQLVASLIAVISIAVAGLF